MPFCTTVTKVQLNIPLVCTSYNFLLSRLQGVIKVIQSLRIILITLSVRGRRDNYNHNYYSNRINFMQATRPRACACTV